MTQQGPITAFIVYGSPEEFYIQLESTHTELDRIGALLKPASSWPVFNKSLVGQMCAAIFDGSYYRGIILSSDDQGATIHYVDYGNEAIATDLRKLPEKLHHFPHLAINCCLESKNGTFSPQLTERFESLSRDDAYEVKFVSTTSSPAIVQLFVDGVLFGEQQETTKSMSVPEINGFEKQFEDITELNKKLDEILDEMSQLVIRSLSSTRHHDSPMAMPKFIESAPLKDGDFVVIRYVESPTLFSVQQTTSICEYDEMMDKLCHYCATAPTILKPQIGMACAAFYQHDSKWYRADILGLGRDGALTRFVDYGIELTIEINKLREIGNEFLLMPKQAISCCILGFEALKATSTVTDKFEFLAENLNGERRQFRVTTHGMINGNSLVNLIDVKEQPVLDFSMRLLQLSLPQEKFREYRQRVLQKNESTTQQSSTIELGSDSVVSPLVHSLGSAIKNLKESETLNKPWSETVTAHLLRIVNEHLARQISWQTLFSLHLSQIQHFCNIPLLVKGREHIVENQEKYSTQKPLSLPAARVPKTTNNNWQMQMIRNHLRVQQCRVPQNMPSFHPTITPPSMDLNLKQIEQTEPPTAVILNEQPTHYMPTFVSDTLIVQSRHQVNVSYVDDGPYIFSVQLKSAEKKMEGMMMSIAGCQLKPWSKKPEIGMACLARHLADNQIYRAIIQSINLDSCQLLYVDYGNSENVQLNNMFDIPEQYLRVKTFAIKISLAGINALPQLTDHVKNMFKGMVADQTLDMVVMPSDNKIFFQNCELSINGQSVLDRVKDTVSHATLGEKDTPDYGFQGGASTSTHC